MPNREQFEAWAKARFLDTTQSKDAWGQPVYSPHIESMWIGWQAGAAAEREACAKICESFGGELTKWPDAYEGATAETQFIRGIGDCISKPFAKAIRDRSAP